MAGTKKNLPQLNTSDEEMFKNLDVLLNLDELEESDFWDEMMNLGELEQNHNDSAKGSHN